MSTLEKPKLDDHEIVFAVWGYSGNGNWDELDTSATDLDQALEIAQEYLKSTTWRWMNVQVKTVDTYMVKRKEM